jgi:hypothetical protein
MPHIFTPRAFKNREVADPVKLSEAIRWIAEKAASGLGEQDFSSTEAGGAKLFTFAKLEADCYYAAYQYRARVSMNLTLTANKYAKQNALGPGANTATVQDTPAWQVITDDVTGTRMEKSIATGEDILVVFAQTQAASWKGPPNSGATDLTEAPLRLQYALRVDGVVMDDTITGAAHMPDWPPRQVYSGIKADVNTNDFDFRHRFWQANGTGLSNYIQPARLTRTIPVVEGTHVVDVVARRLPYSNFQIDNDGEGSSVQVYNRRLFVLRLKGWSKWSGGGPSLTVADFQTGDVLSNTSLLADRLTPIKNALSDVDESAAMRGCFRNEHLPSVVAFGTVTTLASDTATTLFAYSTYNGYDSTTGWWQVLDTLGNALLVDAGGAGITVTDGVLVVLANVQVPRIWVPNNDEPKSVGLFCIRYKDNANVWNYLGETEAAITPRNPSSVEGQDRGGGATDPLTTPGNMNDCDEDVPLMWVVDTRQLIIDNPSATIIKAIEVVGATHDASASGNLVKMQTQRGILTAFLLKGVTLG